jgi:hypothetical protein
MLDAVRQEDMRAGYVVATREARFSVSSYYRARHGAGGYAALARCKRLVKRAF